MKIEIGLLSLPLVFMLHEYEEIIFFRSWLLRNRKELKERFPKVEKALVHRGIFDYSTATFAVGTAHEFVWVTAFCLYALWQEAYHWWFAVLVGHTLHLFIHLLQWGLYRKYIPAIVTALLTLPYCFYAVYACLSSPWRENFSLVGWAFVGVVLAALSLYVAHMLMGWFHRWEIANRKNL